MRASPATAIALKLRAGYIFPEQMDGARWIPLSRGLFALVDEEDYQRVMTKIWTAAPGKTVMYAMYREQPSRNTIFLHRFIFEDLKQDQMVDHINFNGLDCRKSNLRICSSKQNRQYTRKWRSPTSSRFKGVSFNRRYRLKWGAQISSNYKIIRLGRYDNEGDAAKAYNVAANSLFGEFAKLNVIP